MSQIAHIQHRKQTVQSHQDHSLHIIKHLDLIKTHCIRPTNLTTHPNLILSQWQQFPVCSELPHHRAKSCVLYSYRPLKGDRILLEEMGTESD